MHFFKRGFLSIIRKPTKTIILFLIVFILGMLMSGAVSIKNSINNTEAAITGVLEPLAILEVDWEAVQKDVESSGDEGLWEEIVYPNSDVIQAIGELEYVKYYDYSSIQYVTFIGEQEEGIATPYLLENEDSSYLGNLYLNGVNYPEIISIQEGAISLSAGRTLREEEVKEGKPVAVISDKLAEKNNLNVGSTLTTNYSIYDLESDPDASGVTPVFEKYPIAVEVVGIFTVPAKLQEERHGDRYQDIESQRENTIYTTNGYVSKVQQEISDREIAYYEEAGGENTHVYQPTYNSVYVLKQASMLDDFREAASPLLPKYHKVVDTTEPYKNLRKPLENLGEIADTVFVASIGVTILILTLLITLFIHNRRHEIGIYISMGERKITVVSQIVVEIMMIAIVSLSISLFVGNIITKDMSKNMLLEDAQTTISGDGVYQSYDFGGISFDHTAISTAALEDNYEVALDGRTIVLFYGVSIATIAVSTIVPTLYIVRLKPKKILM